LGKSYNLYDVSNQTLVASEIISTEPEVLVDSFDIVDMFRRMPKEGKEAFSELQDLVKDKKRDEVNIELNRYVKDQIEDVKKYFKE